MVVPSLETTEPVVYWLGPGTIDRSFTMVFDMGFKAPSLMTRREPGYTPGCAPLSARFRCGTDSRNTTSDGVLRTLRRRSLCFIPSHLLVLGFRVGRQRPSSRRA